VVEERTPRSGAAHLSLGASHDAAGLTIPATVALGHTVHTAVGIRASAGLATARG
jgi:hypothetical protein